MVICELLGVAYEDRDEFQARSVPILSMDATTEEMIKAREDLGGIFSHWCGRNAVRQLTIWCRA